MSITELIKARHSVRTFDGRPLSDADSAAISQAIADASTPFGGQASIVIVRFGAPLAAMNGTYGVIKGASDFMVMFMADDDESWLSAGFMMEQPVLTATGLGLGTCWMAATFNSSLFSKSFNVPAEQKLRIVTPVGYPARKKRFAERLTKLLANSASRKDFDSLFSYHEPGISIPQDNTFRLPLEMMRLAPSSVNSQPWRAIVADDTVHFYSAGKNRLSMIDMGIGLCHFHLTCQDSGLKGRFTTIPTEEIDYSRWRYICSFVTAP
ncbi:MAG: nitroreductase family protein [Muribaculaceae bacterium]|nr:nitroreductase family protein [Muribaculaceae bacterium]